MKLHASEWKALFLRAAEYARETISASAFEHQTSFGWNIAQREADAKAFEALAAAWGKKTEETTTEP